MNRKWLKKSILTLVLIVTFMLNASIFADSGPQSTGVVNVELELIPELEGNEDDKKDVSVKIIVTKANGETQSGSLKTGSDGKVQFTAVSPGKTVLEFKEFSKDGRLYKAESEKHEFNLESNATETVNMKYHLMKTVKFNTDGGSSVDDEIIKYDTIATKPSNPTKDGFEFVEWQLDEVTYNFTEKVTEDITLVAIWEKVETGEETEEDKDNGNNNSNIVDKNNPNYSSVIWNWGNSDKNTVAKPETLLHRAYLNGYPDGTIKPKGEITRGEVATIISRLHADVEEIEDNVDLKYNDVNTSDWYAKHVTYVSEKGLMEGYEDGTFKPEEKITRAEFATVVARFKNLEKTDSIFEDAKGHWADGYIGTVYTKGWISGYPDGTFKPTANITREEVVKMTNAMLERSVTAEGLGENSINVFSDLELGTWSYYEMIEASNSHRIIKDNKTSETWTEVL